MNDLTMDQFAQEMKMFEGLCNKAINDLDNHINNTTDLQLKDKLIKRKNDFDKFVNYVVNETNFINAPASTRFHLCIDHGLLVHSNSVVKIMLKLNQALNCEIPIYKCITTGLFHDLGKHNDYTKKEPTEKQKAAGFKATPPYEYNTSGIYDEHESESVFIMSKFMELDKDEFMAILYHNSPWDGVTKPIFRQNKLMTILQNADYYSTLYLEER